MRDGKRATLHVDHTLRAMTDVLDERVAQDLKWGEQNHPDGTGGPDGEALANALRAYCEANHHAGAGTWAHILTEEVAEAFAEADEDALRAELVQCAAVCMNWVESIDRRRAGRTS